MVNTRIDGIKVVEFRTWINVELFSLAMRLVILLFRNEKQEILNAFILNY